MQTGRQNFFFGKNGGELLRCIHLSYIYILIQKPIATNSQVFKFVNTEVTPWSSGNGGRGVVQKVKGSNPNWTILRLDISLCQSAVNSTFLSNPERIMKREERDGLRLSFVMPQVTMGL